MVAGLAAAVGGVAGLVAAQQMDQPQPHPGTGSTIDPHPGRWVDVASLHDLPEGRGVAVTAGAVEALVTRRGTSVTAVSAICSHMPCRLDPQSDGTFLCPCHLQYFSVSGRPVDSGYAASVPPLTRVAVRITKENRVEVLGT